MNYAGVNLDPVEADLASLPPSLLTPGEVGGGPILRVLQGVRPLIAEVRSLRSDRRHLSSWYNAASDEASRACEALRAAREWIATTDCNCFGGNAYQEAERCDRCSMLRLIDAALDAP